MKSVSSSATFFALGLSTKWLPWLLLALFCLLAPIFTSASALALGEKEHGYMVGFRSLNAASPDGTLSNIAVWYPSSRAWRDNYSIRIGLWNIRAERNAAPAAGRFPVILLSHDMAGHPLFNHDLCSALANAGFVVIAPAHQGDNFRNANAVFSAALHLHRPQQLAKTLEQIKTDKELASRLDLERIGLLGCGSGAATVLQLAGVGLDTQFDWQAYLRHCANPDGEPAFCSRFAQTRFASFQADAQEISSKYGAQAFTPALPGIKAVALLAPAGIFMLDSQKLARLTTPLIVMFAGKDKFGHAPQNDDELRGLFPDPLYAVLSHTTIADAGHFSLNAPCIGSLNNSAAQDEQLERQPEFCAQNGMDASGVFDEKLYTAFAKERNNYFISFFRASLGLPLATQTSQ